MKNTLVKKAVRTIVGSLISSDFTPQELHQISIGLHDSNFMYDLQETLMGVLDALSVRSKSMSYSLDYEPSDLLSEEVLTIVKRKRLSKGQLLNLIQSISPTFTEWSVPKNITIRQMIEEIGTINPHLLSSLIDKIEASEEDPFLKGIMDRNK